MKRSGVMAGALSRLREECGDRHSSRFRAPSKSLNSGWGGRIRTSGWRIQSPEASGLGNRGFAGLLALDWSKPLSGQAFWVTLANV